MAVVSTYNQKVDLNRDYVFDWTFYEDDEQTPIDISTWTFEFLLKDSNGTTIWDVLNADFGRPSTGRLTFTKTIAQISGLSGLYTISLLVTKTGVSNDEYVNGTYEFSS